MDETNTLYLQTDERVFSDETAKHGLGRPSFRMLGFGTQFLDADLDGWSDLIITNGHVGNHSDEGVAYRMPPQFFRNDGRGKFVEAASRGLGRFFQGEYLGRGLAVLDWNVDGKPDVAISHLDAPAALLTNTTDPCGHFLAVQLRATASARDAIGTTVTLSATDWQQTKQLTAGDGYHASNERQLVFGLGDHDVKNMSMTIRWPSGREEVLSIERRNSRLVVVEGAGQVWQIDRLRTR